MKFIFELLFVLIMLFCICFHELVLYGISQAKGQIEMVLDAKPINEVMADKTFPDSLKNKLTLIEEIKRFAIDSIGIKPSNNYSTVYNQHNKSLLVTVSACEPYALKAKEWYFPFLGAVSYKGFFDKKAAAEELLNLQMKGYDIDVYSPSGWSTLGWFNDPILTNMLYKSEGQLANLIIHELTHSTIYLKSSVTFNENLANFIGDKGAEAFLKHKYGENSTASINYQQSKLDDKCYTNYILKSTQRLDSLYKSFDSKTDEKTKHLKKMELINTIVLGVNHLPLHKKWRYFKFTLQAFSEKNAFFMAFDRYDSQYEIFQKEYQEKYHSNLKLYLNALKNQ